MLAKKKKKKKKLEKSLAVIGLNKTQMPFKKSS